MEIAWQRVLPVIVSIVIIIAVAILREYSKTFAAVAATMPINIPLALWIVSAGSTRQEMQEFTHAVLLNIWPPIVFVIVTGLAARAGCCRFSNSVRPDHLLSWTVCCQLSIEQ